MDIKIIEDAGCWALFDINNLKQYTPWAKTPKEAVEFADKHCSGWRGEKELAVIDTESYKRIYFQLKEIPRLMEQKMKLQRSPTSFSDLVVFHPLKTEVTKASGEKQINFVNDLPVQK